MDDMPFEQFRVLIAATQKLNKEITETAQTGLYEGLAEKKGSVTTYRIINED